MRRATLQLGAAALALLAMSGCTSVATRIRDSATVAARDPWTWGPLAGATLVTITDSDDDIAHWAREETPVFGSQENAQDLSDQLRDGAQTGAWVVFVLAEPRGDGPWFADKGVDAVANLVAERSVRTITGDLKEAFGRKRPLTEERSSFPSGHASEAFGHASMGRLYAGHLHADESWRSGARWGLNAMAITTAWARVEAGRHSPADVLAGAALGNFVTRFFLELSAPDSASGWRVAPALDEESVSLQLYLPL